MAIAALFLALLPGQVQLDEPPILEEDRAWIAEAEAALAAPVDVNSARLEDLLGVPWLSPRVSAAILRARDSLGGFTSSAQLAAIPGVDAAAMAALRITAPERPVRTGIALSATARTESLPGRAAAVAAAWRIKAGGANWSAAANVEKDRGEVNWADFAGAGVEYQLRRTRLAAGDFTMASGLGLVLCAPGARSSYSTSRDAGGPSLRLAGSVDESRYLRGAAFEAAFGRVRVAAGISGAERDARLDETGAVAAFQSGGLHDDSAALARKGQVTEWTGATTVRLRLSDWECGACFCGIRYDKPVAPSDSDYAFRGRDLASAGISVASTVGPYRLSGEFAGSTPGGFAAAAGIDGEWSDLTVAGTARWRSDRYFAPHGRWTGLSGRKQRVDASGRLRYRFAPFAVGFSGSTYRDVEEESLPGRLDAVLEQSAGRLETELRMGRSYRGNLPTRTTGRLTARLSFSDKWASQVAVAYEAEPASGSSGMVVGARVTGSIRAVRLGAGVAWFNIPHGGVRMNLYEPGVGRTGHSFSADTSCLRIATTAAIGFGVGRLALGLAQTVAASGGPDLSAQVEIGLPRG
jgi:hypothetical protein